MNNKPLNELHILPKPKLSIYGFQHNSKNTLTIIPLDKINISIAINKTKSQQVFCGTESVFENVKWRAIKG